MDRAQIEAGVRKVLAERAHLEADAAEVAHDASLSDAGMTSHATVKVMLGLEDHFDIEFPDELLERSIFDRVGSLVGAIEKLVDRD